MTLTPSSLAQWVGAFATSAAVVVALFKDEVLRYFRRPRLRVRVDPKPPDCVLVPNTTVYNRLTGVVLWSGSTYWLRLWVENFGIGRAEQVQVFAAALFKLGANGRFAPITEFEPMNLKWAHSSDPDNPEIFAPGISLGFGKHCDLCSISDPANPTDHEGYVGQCVGALQLEVAPNTNSHRLPPGDYIVKLNVGASNAAPVTAHVQINIKGSWSPDQTAMLRDHLGVQLVSAPPQ